MPVDMFQTLKGLYAELQQEAAGPTFQKIQQYAVLAASTALVMQLSFNSANNSIGAAQPGAHHEMEMSNGSEKVF
jgi:hypothetical protein